MFSVSWEGENNWVNPPWCMLMRAIMHLRRGHARGTVIVPVRPSAMWWPYTLRSAHGVVDVVALPRRIGILVGRAAPRRVVALRAVRFDFAQRG